MATALLVVLVARVGRFGVLTLQVLVTGMVSLLMFGGMATLFIPNLIAAFLCDCVIALLGGYRSIVYSGALVYLRKLTDDPACTNCYALVKHAECKFMALGCKQDEEGAYALYKRAAELGDFMAQKQVEHLAQVLKWKGEEPKRTKGTQP